MDTSSIAAPAGASAPVTLTATLSGRHRRPNPIIAHPSDPEIMILLLPHDLRALIDRADASLVGSFWWSVSRRGDSGYVYRVRQKQLIFLHRWLMNAAPGQEVDHINRNTLDCRRANLRFATRAESNRNRGPHVGNPTGYRGVARSDDERRWGATINVDGRRITLGRFETPEEAARAYDAAARRFHGEFAYLNFPQDITRGRPAAREHVE